MVGSFAVCHHVFTQEATNDFALLCGDNNPLHIDPEFANTTMFGGTIVHGIFVSSLFSTLFGRSLHGAIYVSQTLNFKQPVYVGAHVRAQIEVLTIERKREGTSPYLFNERFYKKYIIATRKGISNLWRSQVLASLLGLPRSPSKRLVSKCIALLL